jgi:uncharacterized surface protein with fasciclin (FAS1) repeats
MTQKNFQRRMVLGTAVAAAMLIPAGLARAQTATDTQDAWTVLNAHPEFSDAVALFKYTGLTQYVQSDRFTAFIPTNAAFNKNPEVLPMLMKGKSRAFPDTAEAVRFVRAHAIYDLHPLSEFSGKTVSLTAISGNRLGISGTQQGIYTVTWESVNGKLAVAHVVDKPLVTANALIYPVDTVILTAP